MGLFGSLIKAAVDVAVTPVAVAKDVVTLGGTLTGEESATVKKAKDLAEDAGDILDDIFG